MSSSHTADSLRGEVPTSAVRNLSRASARYAWIIGAIVALWWALSVDLSRTWGWDESMHAELPAARMVESIRAGDAGGAVDAALECQQYPFVYPLALAGVQLATGVSELTARRVSRVAWALTWVGLWLVLIELELVGAIAPGARRARAAYLSLAFAFLCPLGLAYSGTLFLEVPFALVSVFALRAWFARSRALGAGAQRRRDLVAGAWIALAFFTKFNYGLLLAAGLTFDFAFHALGAVRSGATGNNWMRACQCALAPMLSAAWWFGLPWPGDFELAARHRAAFVAFLQGNQGGPSVPFGVRAIDWLYGVSAHPALSVLVILVAVFAVLVVRHHHVRTLAFVLAAFVVPISLHPFHLDRFLVPVLVPLFALFAVGATRIFFSRIALVSIAVVVIAVGVFASSERVLKFAGLWREEFSSYQLAQLAEKSSILPSRALPTNGLQRGEADALLDAVMREAGREERVGWIGESEETSPAMVHLGLLARGGSRERFLRGSVRALDVSFEGVDPDWSREQIEVFARDFDVIFATDPPDLALRANRRFTAKYRRLLVDDLGWSERELATVEIHKGAGAPYPVRLFACRPPKH